MMDMKKSRIFGTHRRHGETEMPADPQELLEIAQRVVRHAATVHRSTSRNELAVDTKQSSTDLVTSVDRRTEELLVAAIRDVRPDDSILSEEGSNTVGGSGVRWIIDPLDGTTNFVYGYPAHSIAIGIEVNERPVAGVVYDTYHDRLYYGLDGVGAWCDDTAIAATSQSRLSLALVGTGFLPLREVRARQGAILQRLLPQVRDIRRSGCPSLDLCAVASGAMDAYYEYGLGRWDIAGGAMIARAAGAAVVELEPSWLPGPLLVAASPGLIQECIDAILEAEDAARQFASVESLLPLSSSR
jgi:myo-inositol-1(or 4)-monophosphatase